MRGDPGLKYDSSPPVTLLSTAERLRLLGYAGGLLLLINLAAPSGGLIGFPVLFFLKNRLHLSAVAFAGFNLWLGIPLYLSFLFGFLRDRWSPLGAGDRGHFILFGGACAVLYLLLAFVAPTYGLLLGGLLAITATSLIAASAATGIFTAMGQEHLMTGQASTVVNVATMVPTLIGTLLGGLLSQALEGVRADSAASALFLTGAGLMAATALFGGFGPRRLFTHYAPAEPPSVIADVGRLLRHRPVYPVFFILLFWNFAPALGTVMQYHLSNSLHATDAQVGVFYTIYWASNIPTVLLYGYLCQRAPLSRLLFWATIIAIPQMLPLLWVHSPTEALIAAVPVGLVGGFAYAAYIDLAIRASPVGLQATMMMLVATTTFFVAGRFGDLWGTILYEHAGGFTTAVLATTLIYALILPVLPFAPKRLTARADGEVSA
jgi:predicted MFS family arabinose efflux permease